MVNLCCKEGLECIITELLISEHALFLKFLSIAGKASENDFCFLNYSTHKKHCLSLPNHDVGENRKSSSKND
jgi:hypothetical protein